jgi:hypothetical protein
MVYVKSVKIDGVSIHTFKSAIYIFESNSGYTLQLDMIVSEVTVKKYREFDNLIVEIELEEGRIISSIMHLKILPGGLPQLNLFSDLDGIEEFEDFTIIHENECEFPNIEEGITLKDIRKVEMPMEDFRLKLNLPIDQVEWLNKQKKNALNTLFKEMIYDLWKKQD